MQAGADVIRKIVVAKQLAPEGFTSIPMSREYIYLSWLLLIKYATVSVALVCWKAPEDIVFYQYGPIFPESQNSKHTNRSLPVKSEIPHKLNVVHIHPYRDLLLFSILRPKQNDRQFPDGTSSNAFSRMKIYEFRLRFYWRFGPINDIQALVQIMAWCRPGDKPLSEPMMVSLTHIYVYRPQRVNGGYEAHRGNPTVSRHVVILCQNKVFIHPGRIS